MRKDIYLDVQVESIAHALKLSQGGVMVVIGSDKGEKKTVLVTATALRSLIKDWAEDPIAGFFAWDGHELSIRAEIEAPKQSESPAQTGASKHRGTVLSADKERKLQKYPPGLLLTLREVGPWVDHGLVQAITLCVDGLEPANATTLHKCCGKIVVEKFLLKTHVQSLCQLVEVSLYHWPTVYVVNIFEKVTLFFDIVRANVFATIYNEQCEMSCS